MLRRSIRPIPSRTFCSVRAERPLTSRSWPASAAARSPSSESIPSSECKQPHGLRSDARNAQHVEQAIRDLGAQPLVVLEVSRLAELRQLRGQRRSGPRDLRWLASAIERGDVIRVALDDVGHPAVGHRLVDDLSEDLEHVTDLVEDPRELPVADDGLAAARDAAGSGHRRPF